MLLFYLGSISSTSSWGRSITHITVMMALYLFHYIYVCGGDIILCMFGTCNYLMSKISRNDCNSSPDSMYEMVRDRFVEWLLRTTTTSQIILAAAELKASNGSGCCWFLSYWGRFLSSCWCWRTWVESKKLAPPRKLSLRSLDLGIIASVIIVSSTVLAQPLPSHHQYLSPPRAATNGRHY